MECQSHFREPAAEPRNVEFFTKHFFSFAAEAPDLKQEERLQELESCSGVGSTSDDTEVREVSSRPSTPGLSVVSGTRLSLYVISSLKTKKKKKVVCERPETSHKRQKKKRPQVSGRHLL